jgi:enoyl-CoA hydratase/carnithine racemase
MTIEIKQKDDALYISFNDDQTSNSISANDWKVLKTEIEKFEKSEQKYLVLSEINGNFSSGAQLAENIKALMEDVNLTNLGSDNDAYENS